MTRRGDDSVSADTMLTVLSRDIAGETTTKRKLTREEREVEKLRALLDRHVVAAIEALGEIVTDTSAPTSARVSAAREILDRRFGRPATTMEVTQSADTSALHLAAIKAMSALGAGANSRVIDAQIIENKD